MVLALKLLCVALFAWGHVFRDGTPATGSTQLARAIGGFICFLGALAVLPLDFAAVCGGATWLGFYADQKHGDGQGANNWKSIGYLTLSGVTSLLPLVLALVLWTANPKEAVFLIFGFLKPLIWFEAWLAVPRWTPTRIAAGIFGALVGLVVALQ